jgi:ATP-dependent Clp protease ATP-binding subunit ClpB
MQILSRRTKNNPVLLGEPGVGKTAIVEGLAQKIIENEVPDNLKNKEIISLDIGALVAGTKFRGEFEDRLKSVLKEIKASEGKYIIFIDELQTIVGVGAAEGSIDASNLLKPALARGELHLIGATTYKDYRNSVEKDPALERRFQPVIIDEPSIEDTITILRGLKPKYEVFHGVKITDSAIRDAVNLSVRYIPDRFLPDKAIDLIDEAASHLKLQMNSVPPTIANIQKEIRTLEIEKEALKKEEDKESQKRLSVVNKKLETLKKEEEKLLQQ